MHSQRMRKEILTNTQVMALLKAVCETDFELLLYHWYRIDGLDYLLRRTDIDQKTEAG